MKYLPKEEYVYRDCKITLSTKGMADLMYALIITKSNMPTSYCLCYDYLRSQNSRNSADIKVHIHPKMIEKFEGLSNVKLTQPQTAHLNS